MNCAVQVNAPFSREELAKLHFGDMVEITGVVYTARDAAHKRLVTALDAGENVPIPLQGQTIYYAGPCPAPPGKPIGSCGPTTSGRMDSFTPRLLEAGLVATIGKGPRSREVVEAMREHGAVYFAAIGGAAALSARCIEFAEVVAYEDLGPEAVRKLLLASYPCVVAVDSTGANLYENGPERFRHAL